MKAKLGGRQVDREVANAWDRDVTLRHQELATGEDVAYFALIDRVQATISSAEISPGKRILDAGCGLGVMSARLAGEGFAVSGLDLSPRSIQQAKLDFGRSVDFRVGNVARLPREFRARFDVVVASMVLHNHPRLDAVVKGCYAALKDGGLLVATIAEPDMYLAKQNMDSEGGTPRRLDVPLRHMHCCGQHAPVPYFHRSVEEYLRSLHGNRFVGVSVAVPIVAGIAANDVVTFVGQRRAAADRRTVAAGTRPSTRTRGTLRSPPRRAIA